MTKRSFSLFLAIIMLLALVIPAAAQSNSEYLLKVSKVMGTNLGNQINGTFKLGIDGDLTVVKSVEYRIDGQPIGTASEAPFTLIFKTTAYPADSHALSALVSKADGSSAETSQRTFIFLSGEESGQVLGKVVGPILGIVFGVMAVMMLLQFVVMRNRPLAHIEPGTPRNYGLKGGAICKNCGRPFAYHWWAINLLPTMRYDRCDYCGRLGVQHSRTLDTLRKAEQQEAEQARPSSPVPEKSEEDKLKEMMDQTKYTR